MPLRTASRVDGNQPAVVSALRAIGCSILYTHQLKNCFDILAGYRGRTFIIEIKDPEQPPSKRQLTDGEKKFRDEWRGSPYYVVETPAQAIALVTGTPPSKQ